MVLESSVQGVKGMLVLVLNGRKEWSLEETA